MSSIYDYEYQWDSRDCYPNSNVLINKLGITDGASFHTVEREMTAIRIAYAQQVPVSGNFDLAHLQSIHRFVFQDVFDWAGEIRWVNTSKGNMFCNYQFIEQQATDLFQKLNKENFLRDTPAKNLPVLPL